MSTVLERKVTLDSEASPKTHEEIVELIKKTLLDENFTNHPLPSYVFEDLEYYKEEFFQLSYKEEFFQLSDFDISKLISELQNNETCQDAFKKMKHLAETTKHIHYIFCLAYCYEHGVGCKQNVHLAFELHKMLANKKHPLSCVILSNHYVRGEFGLSDASIAEKLRKTALENKNFFTPALFKGTMMMNDPKTINDGIIWLKFVLTKSKIVAPVVIYLCLRERPEQELKVLSEKCEKICLELLKTNVFAKCMLYSLQIDQLYTIDTIDEKLKKIKEILQFPSLNSDIAVQIALYCEAQQMLKEAMICWKRYFENYHHAEKLYIFSGFVRRNSDNLKLKPEFEALYKHIEALSASNPRHKNLPGLSNILGLGCEKKRLKEQSEATLEPKQTDLVTRDPKKIDEIITLIMALEPKKVPRITFDHGRYLELNVIYEEFDGAFDLFKDQYETFCLLLKEAKKSQNDFKYLYLLAVCLEYGIGCRKNKVLAYEIHKTLAQNLNYPLSQLELSHAYETGEFGVIDFKKAYDLRIKSTTGPFDAPNLRVAIELQEHCKDRISGLKYLSLCRKSLAAKLAILSAYADKSQMSSLIAENFMLFLKLPQFQQDIHFATQQNHPMMLGITMNNAIDSMKKAIEAKNDVEILKQSEEIGELIDPFLVSPYMYTTAAFGNTLKLLATSLETGSLIERNIKNAFEAWVRILEQTQDPEEIKQFSDFIQRNQSKLKSEIEMYTQKLHIAAAAGSARALYVMGELKQQGTLFEKSVLHALPCYIQAANLGCSAAKQALACVYTSYRDFLDVELALKLAAELKYSNWYAYGSFERELQFKIKMLNSFEEMQFAGPFELVGTIFDYAWDANKEIMQAHDFASQEMCKLYQQHADSHSESKRTEGKAPKRT